MKTELRARWLFSYAIQTYDMEWLPEAVTCESYAEAKRKEADFLKRSYITCIEITGPHYQRVPT